MARVSTTPFVILGILGVAGRPLSGYDIKHVVENAISHFWSESYGQIYPVLKQMAADKLITARAIHENSRKKITYAITAKGRKALALWMEKPPEQGPMRDELVLKLFFGSQTDVKVLMRHLQGFRDRLKAAGEQYTACLAGAPAQKADSQIFALLTLRGGIAMCEAFAKWADECLAALSQMKGAK